MPAAFLDSVLEQADGRINKSVYSPLVVMWLMVMQRLQGGASLESAVLDLLRGLPANFWPEPCKRIRDWQEHGKAPSSNTAAYNQARQALPLSVVQSSADRIFEQLLEQQDTGVGSSSRVFLLDGSSMRMAHSPELCALYPPGSNRYGKGHWPLIRILVVHDLRTGLAMRPEWGPMHGPGAVSEQGLWEEAISRFPRGSAVMADSNFGIFSVAYDTTLHGHDCLLRLTRQRAQRLAGEDLRDGIDRELVWKPSAADRRRHPKLPADAAVQGRLMVRQVQPDNGAKPFLLALFTTLPGSQEELFELYAQRWAIETDLRTLKSTLRLNQLTCSTPDMVAKEIAMGIAAYNLVRATIGLASQQSGVPPRRYRFTKVRKILETFAPLVAQAPDQATAGRIFDQMMMYVQQAKLYPRRKKRPSYPRVVWKRGGTFPNRKRK